MVYEVYCLAHPAIQNYTWFPESTMFSHVLPWFLNMTCGDVVLWGLSFVLFRFVCLKHIFPSASLSPLCLYRKLGYHQFFWCYDPQLVVADFQASGLI